jgi:REP element-mobilizing transposase RayT
MSEYRITTPDELFFVTLTTVGWIDVFTRNEYKNILIENLKYCQENEKLDIYCYVIMSNHIHLICRRQKKI